MLKKTDTHLCSILTDIFAKVQDTDVKIDMKTNNVIVEIELEQYFLNSYAQWILSWTSSNGSKSQALVSTFLKDFYYFV